VFQVTGNQLTSLPPELGLLTNLKSLSVRQWWQMDLDLNRVTFSGRQEPAHVAASWNRAGLDRNRGSDPDPVRSEADFARPIPIRSDPILWRLRLSNFKIFAFRFVKTSCTQASRRHAEPRLPSTCAATDKISLDCRFSSRNRQNIEHQYACSVGCSSQAGVVYYSYRRGSAKAPEPLRSTEESLPERVLWS
jgi:hypothetical protein